MVIRRYVNDERRAVDKDAMIAGCKKLRAVFGQERELLEQNLGAIQFIVRRAAISKGRAVLTEKDVNDIDELAGEILAQMEVVL